MLLINYAGSEGLNPTDDGVILAQSWRILQGEIPHLDFISIRPVFSGLLHTVNFLFPFPLQITARYFVLFQFFAIAFFVMQFFRLRTITKLPTITELAILLITWIFTIYNYNLYPWTTIDALFCTAIALYFTELAFNKVFKFWYLSVGLFFFVLAALSRQTFALVAIAGWIWTFIRLVKNKEFLKIGIGSFFIGSIPILVYGFVLLKNHGVQDFYQQMMGRNEFFEYAVNGVYIKFLNAENRWVFVSIGIASLAIGIIRKTIITKKLFFSNVNVQKFSFFLESSLALWLLIKSSLYFLSLASDPNVLPYLPFWILTTMLGFSVLVNGESIKQQFVYIWILFISWVSLISIGNNSPVFTFGILSGAILFKYFYKYSKVTLLNALGFKIVFFTGAIFFAFIGTFSQMQVNYRDVGKAQQTMNLKELNDKFGNITTNENTWKYFNEADVIIKTMQLTNFEFCFMPDNPILYPIYRIPNPLSIDWPQSWEIANQTQRFEEELNALINKKVVFIVQKVNVRKLAQGFYPINENEYPYLQIIKNKCRQIKQYEYFVLYQQ
ncbi:MAG: hypothetical protein JEZ09_14920 [Salinivirgaceae bacterium]|nr:hypothetical protein [Salinivirgaceae bacterium]